MTRREDPYAEPKDFLAVRAPYSLQITPATPRGWRATLLWVLALLVPHIFLTVWAIAVDETPQEKWVLIALLPILAVNGLTVWAMIRWMLARAEVVTPDEILRKKRGPK